MKKTFASFSFGCRVNQAETVLLNNRLANLGFSYNKKNPSFYLINTCAVTHKAEREARQKINQVKHNFPNTKVIVTGCAATRWIRDGVKVEGVDLVVDNTDKEYLSRLIAARFNDDVKGNFLRKIPVELHLTKYRRSGRILIKIQDGCHRFCTFCIVPYLRGLPRSRTVAQIVKAIKSVEDNVKEAILTAINTEAFGYDTGEKFTGLIKAVLTDTNIERLSFGSIHPWSITEELLSLYGSEIEKSRWVKFFHIPLQSGANKILKLMKRGYTPEEFLEKLEVIKGVDPLTFIATDIIAGFLGETEKDFAETYQFLEKSPIVKFHVFPFSKRERTAAYYMARRITEPSSSIKKRRAKLLRELSKRKYENFLAKHLGETLSALFLDKSVNGRQLALLDNQIPVNVEKAKNLAGEVHRVVINRIENGALLAEIV